MTARPDAPRIVVTVDHPCDVHGPGGQPFMGEIEALTSFSAFMRSSENN